MGIGPGFCLRTPLPENKHLGHISFQLRTSVPSLFWLRPSWVLMGVALGWKLEAWLGQGKHSLQLPGIGNSLPLGVLSLLLSKVSVGSALKFSHHVGNVAFFHMCSAFWYLRMKFHVGAELIQLTVIKGGQPNSVSSIPPAAQSPFPLGKPWALALGTSFAQSVLLPGMAGPCLLFCWVGLLAGWFLQNS